MKKKIICMTLATTMFLSTTVSAAPWWLSKYRVTFDNELGIVGNVTLTFASDGGSFIRPITKRYGESISLESMLRQNMVTHSKVGSPIQGQSRIR